MHPYTKSHRALVKKLEQLRREHPEFNIISKVTLKTELREVPDAGNQRRDR